MSVAEGCLGAFRRGEREALDDVTNVGPEYAGRQDSPRVVHQRGLGLVRRLGGGLGEDPLDRLFRRSQ